MKKDNKTFVKHFWSYIFIIIIPVIILGFLTLGILFNNLARDTKALNNNILEQCGNVLDGEMEKMLTLSYGIEQNDMITTFVEKWGNGYHMTTYDFWEMINELSRSKVSNGLCQEIGLYFKKQQMVITNTTIYSLQEYYEKFFSGSAYSFEQWQEELSKKGKENYFLTTTVNAEAGEEKSIVYCRNLTYANQFGEFVFFARINTNDLINKLVFTGIENIDLAVVDKNAKVILQSNGFDSNLLSNTKKNSNNRVEKASNVMNLKYVYQLPEKGLSGNVHRAMMIFLLMLVLTILISFVLASIQARRVQDVMRNAFDEINGLKGDIDKQLKVAKEKTLLNLLHNVQIDEKELKRLETEYAGTKTGELFNVMVLSLSYIDDINLYLNEIELVWSEINDMIMKRLGEMHIRHDVIRIDLQTCIYVLCYENREATARIKELPTEVFDAYKFRIYLGLGEETEQLNGLNISYDGAMSALRYSLNEKSDGIAYYRDIKNVEITKIYYTVEKEQLLIRSIRLGEEESVQKILDEVYHMNFHNRHLASNTLKRLITSLTITIYKVLDECYAADGDKYEKFGRVCQNVARNDDLEEAFQCLEEICLSLCRDIGKSTGRDTLKKQITDYILENYQNDALNLEMLADHLGISYYYLSRLLKELLGTSFVRYLTTIRLEKAKQLLEKTGETIEQIAKQTGFYSSDSLIRTFKKYYGVTPSKYRKQGL